MLDHARALAEDLGRGFTALVFPPTCFACGRSLPPDQRHFCASCRAALTTDPHSTCPRCGSNLGPYVAAADGCSGCRDSVFRFERVVRLGPYEGRLRDMILRMKHPAGEILAEVVGILWAEHAEEPFKQTGVEMVIPVPLHWWRRLRRGYNQSESLARAIASRLKVPCRPRWLRRTRNTPSQTEQTAAERRTNVKNAFFVRTRPELRGRTVLLVDDVTTTGSTCSEAARALVTAGAARVIVAVLAHSPS